MGWECSPSYPIGRFALFGVIGETSVVVRELGVHGVRISDSLAHRIATNVSKIYSSALNSLHKRHPDQAIDGSILYSYRDKTFGFGAIRDDVESRYSIELEDIYEINQIIVIYQYLLASAFENIVGGVQIKGYEEHIVVCGTVGISSGRMPYYFDCPKHTFGDRVSFFRREGSRNIFIVEVFVVGNKSSFESKS